ncbi:hypothetical protein TYRP_006985 [Tyrophagus putrescentiae]|nr:hypothetical protein TYRP_006985 [Tyrophagus putrescentiae]
MFQLKSQPPRQTHDDVITLYRLEAHALGTVLSRAVFTADDDDRCEASLTSFRLLWDNFLFFFIFPQAD